jgi:hypothetical protein
MPKPAPAALGWAYVPLSAVGMPDPLAANRNVRSGRVRGDRDARACNRDPRGPYPRPWASVKSVAAGITATSPLGLIIGCVR